MATPDEAKFEDAWKVPGSPHCAITMKANSLIHEHTATGTISVHTLNDHIRLHLPERVVDILVGHLLALDHCVPHDVEAS